MTSLASASFRPTSACIAWRIWSSTSPPIASSVCFSASSSSWKCRVMGPSALAEPAGDVVLGLLLARIGEQLARHTELLQLEHQLRDARGGDRVEGRAGLVHQQHVGLDGDRARDAEALLLPAGQAERALVQPILHLVPERGGPQAPFHDALEVLLVAEAEDARAIGHVLEDRLRKRVRLLEHHPHPLPEIGDVQTRIMDVRTADADAPGDLHTIDEIV